MFSFGNDDKEKLRENMEQIKDMVEEGQTDSFNEETRDPEGQESFGNQEGAGEFGEGSTGLDDFPAEGSENQDVQNFDSPSVQKSSSENFDDSSSQSFDESNDDVERELDEFEEKFGTESESKKEVKKTSKDTDKRSSGSVNELSKNVPAPPETRDIDVPEIDTGPLFLRQQKFLGAKKMIEEMLFLLGDLERTVNDLETGISKDQEIERDVREIMSHFEDNRSEVEGIISPADERG